MATDLPRIAFPSDLADPTAPDPASRAELAAASAAGFVPVLYDCRALWAADADAVARSVPQLDGPVLHRGYMLSDARYVALRDALASRGGVLLPDPAGYGEAHFLPRALTLLGEATPITLWMDGTDPERAWTLYQRLADGDVVLKDHVKSCKQRWREACFVPARSGRERFEEVVRSFLACRGPKLEGGLVLRRFEPFRLLRRDMRGMPIHDEHRIFFWRGDPFWTSLEGDLAPWSGIARSFRSPFMTLDIARREDGALRVVESGDGGVSGLPTACDPELFFVRLAAAIHARGLPAT